MQMQALGSMFPTPWIQRDCEELIHQKDHVPLCLSARNFTPAVVSNLMHSLFWHTEFRTPLLLGTSPEVWSNLCAGKATPTNVIMTRVTVFGVTTQDLCPDSSWKHLHPQQYNTTPFPDDIYITEWLEKVKRKALFLHVWKLYEIQILGNSVRTQGYIHFKRRQMSWQ
jgi:hypothetical protein